MGTVASSWFQSIAWFLLACLFACLAAFPLSCLSLSHKHPQISHAEIPCSLLLLHKCTQIQQGVCHTVALPFTLKSTYLKATEELWKLKYFTMQKYT
jgi:hypothetical protein